MPRLGFLSSERLRQFGGWLLLLAVTLVAVQPLLGGVLPWTADGLLHFHRLAQLHRSLNHGILFPRWAPDMGLGYGFPLFNYYAPLSYYLAEPLRLIGLSTQNALLAGFVLAVFAGCIGTYLCAHDLFGAPAGFVAAAAFTYAPYHLYNAVHRGALAELWGLAWLPFVFWALRRLALRSCRTDLALSSLFYAALLLTHNVLALISTPLFALYATFLWALHGRGYRRALLLGGALALGLGLSAFFWAPAFLEREYVQIHQLYAPADLDYHNNFTDWGRLLAAPQPVDPKLINPWIPLSFGWPQLALALVALLGLRRFAGQETRLHLVLLLLGLLALTVMMLPCSVAVWDSIPVLRFVQFPWRFLGPASLFLAILAGAGAARLPGSDRFWLPAILTLVIVFTFTWLFPHFYPPQPEPTPLTLIGFERETGALGTTSAGDYLPVWVQSLPPADSLIPAYEESAPDFVIPRLDLASLPADAQVLEARYDLTAADLLIETPQPFTAVFNWYFFPGWQASLDDQPLALRPVGEHGLVGADVPAGRHHLRVHFGDTTLRRWASVASVLSLAALLALLMFPDPPFQPPVSNLQFPSLLPPALIVLALFAIKAVYLDRHATFLRHSRFDGQSVAGVQVPLNVNFDDQLILMGYDLTSAAPPSSREGLGGSVRGDGLLELALYWRTRSPLNTDYSIAVHLVDDQGRRYGQKDSQHPAGYPTSRWKTEDYARDLHRLAVWPGTPPGEYALLVGVYDVATGRSLDVRDAAGVPIGTTHVLASVWVTRTARPPDPSTLELDRWLQADVGGGLCLLGLDLPPSSANAGERLPLTLYWQAVHAPVADYTARLSLAAPDGAVVAEESAVPGRASHPTSAWLAGDVVRDGRSLLVPAATPAGDYALQLDLLDAADRSVGPVANLSRITVHAPERRFDLPPMQHTISATLDGQATLLGYDLGSDQLAPGEPFTLALYWRAEATAEIGHVVFVHLLDKAERIHAQSDRVPADGARPTTGWLPGEIIADSHTLVLVPDAAPGRYILEVGMYDPANGERLRVLDADDRILLPTPIQVE
jgi:hypothetical protein